MYVYAYDAALADRKRERDLAAVETRLTDLGITGTIVRLGMYRDPGRVLRDEVKRGATTLIAVGGEAAFRLVIAAATDTPVVAGFIPMGEGSTMAELLGIPAGAAACDVLSARLVEEMDVGEINGRRFLHAATLDASGGMLRCDERYTVTFPRKCSVQLRNLAWPDDAGAAHPADGLLTLVARTQQGGFFAKKEGVSVVSFARATLFCPDTRRVDVDGETLEAREFDLRAVPRRIRVICGRGRKYMGE